MTATQLLPVIWILASMVVYVLETLLVSQTQLTRWQAAGVGRWLIQIARLLYYLGVPYAALLAGVIAPVDMGLTGVAGPVLGWTGAEWLHSVGLGLIAGAVVLIPIGIAARQMDRAGHPLGVDERSAGAILVDSIYAESHWAFYRTAPLMLLDNVYVATLIGLGLIGVELLVSLLRSGLGQYPEERQSWLGTLLLLTLSAALFVLTRNLWVMILTHIAVEMLIKWWATRLARRTAETQLPLQEPAYDPDVRLLNEQPEA